MGLLGEHRPDDAVLSEEAADDPVRLASSRVWIVDPLDGTREFSERPRDDWAVHVALWEEGGSSRVPSPSRPGRWSFTGWTVPHVCPPDPTARSGWP